MLRNFLSGRAMPLGERDGPAFSIWFQKWSALLPLWSFYIFIIRTFVYVWTDLYLHAFGGEDVPDIFFMSHASRRLITL